MTAIVRRLVGLAQQGSDLADYVVHRGWMKLQFHVNRIRHRWLLGTAIRRILVVRLGSIGDVVRASAIVGLLRERYPDAEIDFLTTEVPLPMIQGHPGLNRVYTLTDLTRLGEYDWTINLQNRDPQESFLRGSGLTYHDVLLHLSTRLRCAFMSGRHIRRGRETTPTNILYCVAEMEELFLTALLPYDPRHYPRTAVHVDEKMRVATQAKFALSGNLPRLAIFLGSNSVGCGADEGFRTYSMDFVEQLIACFAGRFAIAVIGQSQMRNAEERQRYQEILRQHPDVVDLVDKTTLQELACLMDEFSLLISCDSSPVHLAQARGVPVIGLYVCDASYRLGPALEYERLIGLNSTPPCFYYSWRWKFFCGLCRDPQSRAAYCRNERFVFGVDRIPLERIGEAADRLLHATSGL